MGKSEWSLGFHPEGSRGGGAAPGAGMGTALKMPPSHRNIAVKERENQGGKTFQTGTIPISERAEHIKSFPALGAEVGHGIRGCKKGKKIL